jgi:hypothetical protein
MIFGRTPAWSEGMFEGESLFRDEHTQALANYLQDEAPYLLQQWFWVVRTLATRARQERECLNELKLKQRSLEEVIYREDTDINQPFVSFGLINISIFFKRLRMMPKGKGKHRLMTALSMGLSFQQFIAISELLGVQLGNVQLKDLILLLLSGAAAISLTFAAKEGIIRWVRATRRAEPEQTYPHIVPFWKRLQAGDTLCWCTILVVIGETAFASPGFLALLPPRLAAELSYQVVAFLFTGLAAYINVFLAWGIGLEENADQRSGLPPVDAEYFEGSKQPSKPTRTTFKPSNIKRLNGLYTHDIKEQKKVVRQAERLAGHAYQKWSREVKRLIKSKERNERKNATMSSNTSSLAIYHPSSITSRK